jgi:predicted sugar kinase
MTSLVVHPSAFRSFAVIPQNKVKHTGLGVGPALFRNIDALAEGDHQRVQEALLFFLVVVFTQHRLDSLGGLLGFVERNATEKVVNNVVINDFVEEVATDKASCAVDSSQGSFGVGPGLGGVVRNVRVGVLKVCNSNCRPG